MFHSFILARKFEKYYIMISTCILQRLKLMLKIKICQQFVIIDRDITYTYEIEKS